MSERGVFAVDRGLFDHPSFADEPFTEREAWIWLIKEAAWRDRKVRVGRGVVTLARGQCAASTRFMADRWKWSEARVRRFLNRLKTDALITTDIDAQATRITICKYNEYQRVSLPRDADIDALNDGEQTQNRRKQEDREYIEDKKDTPSGATVVAFPASGVSTEKDVYASGKALLGTKAGGVITKLRKACEYDDALAAEYLRQASEKQNPMEWLQAVLKASTPENRAYRGVEGVDAGEPIKTKAEREYDAWEEQMYRGVQ